MTQAQKERSDILIDVRSLTDSYYRADAVARQQAAKQYFMIEEVDEVVCGAVRGMQRGLCSYKAIPINY